MARELKVKLVADARPFNNTLDAAIGRVTGFSNRLRAMGGGSLGKGVAMGAGIAGFNLLTSSIGLAVSKMDEMHQAYLDDEASQARLQLALKNSVTNYEAATKASEDFAAAQIDLGFEDDEVRDSISQLIGVTKDYAEAIRLTSLAEDLARAKNIDLATATDAITKGYLGQGRALQALGIDLRGAAGGAEILDRTLKNVNGAAVKYANTGAGRVAKANAKMAETMEKVGKAIDAVSQFIIPIMVDGLAELVAIAEDIIGVFAKLIGWVEGLARAIDRLASSATRAQGPLGAILNIAKTIASVIPGGNIYSTPGFGEGGGPIQLPPVNSVTYPGGFNTWPKNKTHHEGGIVAGPAGSDQLIMAQAGERVIPRGQSNGQTIIVNIASFIGSDRDIDRFSDRLAFRLRSTSLS